MKVSTLLVFCLSCVASATILCPPACDPPNHVTGCQAYQKNKECKSGMRDVSISVASCGCLWESHIQLVEPESKVVFTDAGNQCYKWAAKVCEKQESVSIVKPIAELLRRVKKLEYAGEVVLEKEIAKSRRRTGVTLPPLPFITEKPLPKPVKKEVSIIGEINRENPVPKPVENGVSFIGKHSRGAASEWVEVEREKKNSVSSPWVQVMREKANNSPTGTAIKTSQAIKTSETGKNKTLGFFVFQHWFNIQMQDDQFKLIVFMVVLLLNILVVIGMVICRNPSKARKAKEPKQCGDLDLSTYRPKKPDETRKNFFEKLNWLPKWKQQSGMPGIPYLPMENGNVNRLWKPEEKYSQTSSTFLPVLRPQMVQPCDSLQKHYETQEDSYLDHTYEEPMSVAPSRPPSCRETGLQHSSLQELSCMACSFETESDDYSSPTKYFPRSTEEPHNVSRHMEEPRTVSFALPQGTYLTIQDRIVASPRKRRKKKGLHMVGKKVADNKRQPIKT